MEFRYVTPQLDCSSFLQRLALEYREQILTHAQAANINRSLVLQPDGVTVASFNDAQVTQGILWISYSIKTNTAQNFTGEMSVNFTV